MAGSLGFLISLNIDSRGKIVKSKQVGDSNPRPEKVSKMPSKEQLKFLRSFEQTIHLIKTGIIHGVQLRFNEKPGQTVANAKEVSK